MNTFNNNYINKLNIELKDQIEQISFKHTLKVLNGNLSIMFYDMTTLYFEASDEDDLRKTGFSKDGKHSNPQIYLGLLVGLGGYAIGYDIFEGNKFEGDTFFPYLINLERNLNWKSLQLLQMLDYYRKKIFKI